MASPVRDASEAQSVGETPTPQDRDAVDKSYKRRRISRACDDCRRKKIKCDGRQPCSSCAEFNSECYYEIPSRRNKAPRSGDVEGLEARLHAAESIIRRFLPHIDLQTLGSAASSPQQTLACDNAREDGPRPAGRATAAAAATGSGTETPKYIPLIDSQHQLRLTDSGEFDFHGLSSDAAFLSRITQHFPELRPHDSRIPFLSHPSHSSPLRTPSAAALPWLPHIPMGSSNYDYSKLPPRELARMLCEYSFNHATCLLRIIHVPSFYKRFDLLYDSDRRHHARDEAQYLGLLYSVLALGSMYDVDENDPSNPDHYDEAMRRGYKFYLGARLYLKDLSECRDLTTLQALLFIIQFLQALGNLNSCYNLIGIALRSALQMGLHRHIDDPRMSPIESETRKRVFHTTRQMDIYLSTTLGLPVVLQGRDIDQPLPTAVDDADITISSLLQPQPGSQSMIEAFNAHATLMDILAMVVECMYPSQSAIRKATHVTYMINYTQVRQVEQRLHEWYQQLPAFLRPGYNEDVHLNRVQILLRFAYAHVQMMLYRPFMLYSSHRGSSGEKPDRRNQALTTAGISVCRNIINIGLEIRNQGVLIGPYWFITYTQFFAVLCLIFYVLHNPDEPGFSDILADAILGKDAISGLNQRSLAADRLSAALQSVFDNLPQRLSTEIQRIKGSLKFQLRTPNRHRPVSAYGAGHTDLSSFSEHQGQWQLPVSAGTAMPGMIGHMPVPLNDQTAQSGPVAPATSSSGLAPDRLVFPLGDPIAYPSALGGTATHNSLPNNGDDTMQLIVPDFFDNLNEHSAQSFGGIHADRASNNDLGLGSFQTLYPRFSDDPIARMFDDLETVKL